MVNVVVITAVAAISGVVFAGGIRFSSRFVRWLRQRKTSALETKRRATSALETDEGRAAFAQAMAEPIRRSLEYNSVGRRLFALDELPPGALPRYNADPASIAHVVSRGDGPVGIIEGEEAPIVNNGLTFQFDRNGSITYGPVNTSTTTGVSGVQVTAEFMKESVKADLAETFEQAIAKQLQEEKLYVSNNKKLNCLDEL